MTAIKRHSVPLLVTLAIMAHLIGCAPAPSTDPVLGEDAQDSDYSTAQMLPPVPSIAPAPIPNHHDGNSDQWDGPIHNEDGGTQVEIVVVSFQEETRTRTVFDDSGESWEEAFVVTVPVEETRTVIVPAGMDVDAYLDEHYPPLEELIGSPQGVDLIPVPEPPSVPEIP